MNHTLLSKSARSDRHNPTFKRIRVLPYFTAVALCIIVLTPFIIMVSYSLRSNAELYNFNISLFPQNPTLESYRALWTQNPHLKRIVVNTISVTILSTALTLVFSTMMGYAIARFRFAGRKPLWFILAMTQSIPWIIALIPLYMTLSSLKLLDDTGILALVYTACFIPVATWLLVGFFKKIPSELEEAARIDGCSQWGVFLRIIIPLSTNAMCAVGLTTFIGCWGDYITASTLLKSKGNWTLTIGIMFLQGSFNTEWTQIMALGTLITVPVVVLFLWLERYLVNLMAGGIKE